MTCLYSLGSNGDLVGGGIRLVLTEWACVGYGVNVTT